jgi:hypothetical protein
MIEFARLANSLSALMIGLRPTSDPGSSNVTSKVISGSPCGPCLEISAILVFSCARISQFKIMEGREKGVPSVIRFQRFDKLSIGTGKRLYEFGSLVIPCDETGAAFCDRKRDVLGSPRYAVAIGECSVARISRLLRIELM